MLFFIVAYLAITYQQEHLEANLKAKLIALLLISLFLFIKKTMINILEKSRN
ncbi:hypothetical protein M7W_2075 [Enterococcus faecium ATCC 8459 = NRRL B-2354]|nr:hypothetical protein M7W_2075 [Enterococcus faecium ATCC 8459 = NRRL B-2354]